MQVPYAQSAEYLKAVALVDLIRAHGCEADVNLYNGTPEILAVEVYTRDGQAFAEEVVLPAHRASVLDWLGY
jgi:hypothetical protein